MCPIVYGTGSPWIKGRKTVVVVVIIIHICLEVIVSL